MRFLLDTNVISETAKATPHEGVAAWLDGLSFDAAYIPAVSMMELRYGVERLPAGRRREALARWIDVDLPSRFAGRVLAIDESVADVGGRLWARAVREGRTPDLVDVMIAAMAVVHDLALATRNTRDFAAYDVRLVDPWEMG